MLTINFYVCYNELYTLKGEKKMKKLIGLNLIGLVLIASSFLNIITMTDSNNGKDLQGYNYYMEGYGKGDKILIVENSYYEVIKEFKLN